MAKINLDKLIEGAVHGPRVDNFVLYGKVPEYKASTEYDKAEMNSVKFIKASEQTYNSPNNIRRVFITHGSVSVQYYSPYILKGKPNSSNWKTKSIRDLGLKEIAESSIMMEANRTQNIMQQVIDGKQNTQLTGNGLRWIVRPWVCSNLEELYFDYTLLDTENNKQMINGITDAIFKLVSNQPCMDKSIIPYEIFKVATGVTDETLKEKFPRLRMIALISNLDDIMSSERFNKLGRITSVEESKITWIQDKNNMSLIQQAGGMNLYFTVNSYLREYFASKGQEFKSDAFNSNLEVRSGIYKFDRIVLENLKDKLNKIKESTRINNETTVPLTTDTTKASVKSDEEIKLDSILAKDGEQIVSRVIKLTVIGMKKSEVEALFNGMSDEGKQRYMKMI